MDTKEDLFINEPLPFSIYLQLLMKTFAFENDIQKKSHRIDLMRWLKVIRKWRCISYSLI
tara:strand:+ start:18020 stop:18199 length:180 start_codon:yes stop_codon:yes gene_type:complete